MVFALYVIKLQLVMAQSKEEAADICKEEPPFCSHGWIDRVDDIKPEKDQLKNPNGRVKWHPGWCSHQPIGHNPT
jgi:hypothetical protein